VRCAHTLGGLGEDSIVEEQLCEMGTLVASTRKFPGEPIGSLGNNMVNCIRLAAFWLSYKGVLERAKSMSLLLTKLREQSVCRHYFQHINLVG
jgi:hypothetical protein